GFEHPQGDRDRQRDRHHGHRRRPARRAGGDGEQRQAVRSGSRAAARAGAAPADRRDVADPAGQDRRHHDYQGRAGSGVRRRRQELQPHARAVHAVADAERVVRTLDPPPDRRRVGVEPLSAPPRRAVRQRGRRR
ncbi:hypothetical protein LTR94_033936, partial [Friedmanniomyces endolithicus]